MEQLTFNSKLELIIHLRDNGVVVGQEYFSNGLLLVGHSKNEVITRNNGIYTVSYLMEGYYEIDIESFLSYPIDTFNCLKFYITKKGNKVFTYSLDRLYTTYNGDNIIGDIRELVIKFNNTEGLIYDDNLYYIKDLDIFTNCSDGFYEFDNIRYSKIPEGYVKTTNGDYLRIEECYICKICGEYHRSRTRCPYIQHSSHGTARKKVQYTERGKISKVKVGFEVERNSFLSEEETYKLKKNGWEAEHDGSINGGEYISPVLDIEEVGEYFNQFDFLFGDGDHLSCGGHIHFSIDGQNSETTYKEVSPFRPLLWAIFPTRARGRYSSKDTSSIYEKYRDVTVKNNTVEFRIFPGVHVKEDIIFRTELLKFIYNNRIIDNKTYDNFNVAKDIIQDKIEEIVKIILIRYNKNTIPGILGKIREYYNTENVTKKIHITEDNSIYI